MAEALSVRKVEGDADLRAFFEFPWRVHGDSPAWVPPMLSMRHELLDKQKNPAWQLHGGRLLRRLARRTAGGHYRRLHQSPPQRVSQRAHRLVRRLRRAR